VQYAERLMLDSWETETSVEDREIVNPLIISLEETSEGELDSQPVPLE
jgi:hypothetical protein